MKYLALKKYSIDSKQYLNNYTINTIRDSDSVYCYRKAKEESYGTGVRSKSP